MAIERAADRDRRTRRGKAAHGALAQRPGGHRRRDVRARARRARDRARSGAAWSDCSGSPTTTPTGRCRATRTCSAPSRCCSATTCWPTSGCCAATRRASRSRASAASKLPLGSGALAGVGWELDREAVARELGFESVTPNSIDAVSSRDFVLDYLSAAATCGDSPVATRRRDRAVVEPRVRVLRARRRVLLGLEHHAAEEEPRRRRAPARQGAADRRRSLDARRRAARAAARLLEGHAGGQGGRCSTPSTRSSSASRRPTGCCAG